MAEVTPTHVEGRYRHREGHIEFVLSLVPSLQLLIERIAHYSKLITSFFEQQQEHELFESLPAAGKRLGPRLLVGLTAFEATTYEAKHAQQIAGTAPVTKQSGKSRQVVQRQACDKSLRNTLYQYSLQTLKQVPWTRAYYEEKVRQGKKNAAALRSLSTSGFGSSGPCDAPSVPMTKPPLCKHGRITALALPEGMGGS